MLATCSWVKGFAGLPSMPGLVPAAFVALTLRSAPNRATGILPVPGHGQDGHGTSMSADLKVSATTAAGTNLGIAGSPAKPFTQEQVVSMVRDGFGDESGAKLIERQQYRAMALGSGFNGH